MKKTLSILGILPVLVFSSCLKIAEYYAGLNLQPNMENSPFQPGLNVFGIVKAGQSFDTLNYYFEVQKMIDPLDFSEGIEEHDAKINLHRTTINGEEYSYKLEHLRDGIYIDESLETNPGDAWEYTCSKDSFLVTANCIVPNYAQLQSTPEVSNDGVAFTVTADTTAYMYLVYLLNGENYYMEYKIPEVGRNITFNLKPEWNVTNGSNMLFVCAFDKNMREYNTTSNTFFKPNAYRPSFSTVEGGYGTFGAVSISNFSFAR